MIFQHFNLLMQKNVEEIVCFPRYINKVKKTKYWKELEEGVREIARLRLENPEMSIEALGKKLDPPISKSGANHRLKKIMELAKEI